MTYRFWNYLSCCPTLFIIFTEKLYNPPKNSAVNPDIVEAIYILKPITYEACIIDDSKLPYNML